GGVDFTILTTSGIWEKINITGAGLSLNQYGPPDFAAFFFFITGFHGTHVLSGVLLNFLIYYNTVTGVYDRRGSYEMVEKVGLYWHFVDLVWVFVFTFFYLV
ncbi:MAG: cytochrome c oxidase subunit 3, partial [Bacteroidota bacterium]